MIFVFPTYTEAKLFITLSPLSQVEICGVGLVACAAVVSKIAHENSGEVIVLAGIAGTYLESRVAIGEVVEVVEEHTQELPEKYQVCYKNPQYFSHLRAVKSNSVNSPVHFSELNIENMEGAAMFAICRKLGVRCAEIRAISNRVGDDFSEWSTHEAIEALTAELLKIVK